MWLTGHEIAPNAGTDATNLCTLATKSLKLVAKLATIMLHHTLRRDIVNEDVHLDRCLEAILDLGEFESCIIYEPS